MPEPRRGSAPPMPLSRIASVRAPSRPYYPHVDDRRVRVLCGVGKRFGRDVIGRHLEGFPEPRAETRVERNRHGRAPGQGFKAIALSRFGTWSHLGTTRSSARGVCPRAATLSFRAARFASPLLTLRTTDLADSAGLACRAARSRPRPPPAAEAGRDPCAGIGIGRSELAAQRPYRGRISMPPNNLKLAGLRPAVPQ